MRGSRASILNKAASELDADTRSHRYPLSHYHQETMPGHHPDYTLSPSPHSASMSTKPAIVIVPGGGHLSGAYRKLVGYLTTHGYDVTAVDIPSNTITTNPAAAASHPTTFAGDVASVSAAIVHYADRGRDVAMLFHSYGGLPGSTACKDLLKTTRTSHNRPGGVVHAIYLASMALPLGASVYALSGGQMPPFMDVSADGKTMTGKDPRGMFFEEGTMSEADFEFLLANIKPMATQAFEGQVGFEAWREVEATYIVTLADTSLTTEMQRGIVASCDKAMAEDGQGKRFNVVELEGGHEPFVTRPEKLGEVVRGILGESV